MNRARLSSLLIAAYAATYLFSAWPGPIDGGVLGTTSIAAGVGLLALGLAGIARPDRFGTEYTPTWLLVGEAVALASMVVGVALLST